MERVAALGIPDVESDANYQLNIEDALACDGRDLVVFVDAARGVKGPFVFERIEAGETVPAMTHALPPGGVLAVARSLFGRAPEAYVLGIVGYEWEQGDGLSSGARANLDRACVFLAGFLKEFKR